MKRRPPVCASDRENTRVQDGMNHTHEKKRRDERAEERRHGTRQVTRNAMRDGERAI
jgi:hypothetical protein